MESALQELTQYTGSPTVSILVSTQVESFEEKKKLKLRLKNALKQATDQLKQGYDDEIARKLMNSARSLSEKIDMNHLSEGLGLFIAPGFKKKLLFPFEVQDKVVVEASFEVSDLQSEYDKMPQYSVLLLSKQVARLFQGKGNRLEEREDQNFPLFFEEQFQVHRASPHSFYNSEESEIDQARLNNYYRKIEKLAYPSLKGNPLMLMGTVKALSDFRAICKNEYHIFAEIQGNFDKFKVHEIVQLVEPEVEKLVEKGEKMPSIS